METDLAQHLTLNIIKFSVHGCFRVEKQGRIGEKNGPRYIAYLPLVLFLTSVDR